MLSLNVPRHPTHGITQQRTQQHAHNTSWHSCSLLAYFLLLFFLQDYDDFTEARAWELLAAVSLDESDMDRLSEQLFGDSGEPVGKGLSVGGFAQAAAPAVAAAGGAEGGVSAGSAKAAAVTAAQGNGLVAAACS